MAVAQVNVGFQVKLKELDEQMKKANALFRSTERSFKSVGSEFVKTGQMLSQVNKPLGDAVGRFGEMGSMVPEVGKEIAKLNLLVRANPWIALGTAIAAAGVAMAVFMSRSSQAAKLQKTLTEVTVEANKSIAEEQTSLNVLLAVSRDESRSKEDRLKAIKAINELSPKYLGNLNLETINTDKATAAVNNYISALRDKAKQQAIEGKMAELIRKRVELEMSKVGESGAVQQAFDKLWSLFGVESSSVVTSRKDLEDYIKTLNLSGESAEALRKVYEPLLKVREKELSSIDAEIAKLEELAAAAVNAGTIKTKSSGEIIKQGTIRAFEYQIELLQKYQKEVVTTAEQYKAAADKIEAIQKKIDALSAKRDELQAVKVVTPPIEGTRAYYDELIKKTTELRDAQVIGSLMWEKYNNQLKDIDIEIKAKTDTDSFHKATAAIENLTDTYERSAEIQAEIDAKRAEKAKAVGQAVGDAFDVMSSNLVASMNEGETALDRFGSVMLQTSMKLLSMLLSEAIGQAVLNGTISAQGTGLGAVFAQPAFIATAVGGVLAAFASIPKFADGGLVYGPTVGLMGEYAGAANNPEVIAPLNKLKELISPAGVGDVSVSLGLGAKISGSDLAIVIERAIVKHLRKS